MPIRDEQVLRARALAMVERRIRSVPLKDIAAEFNVTIRTVERNLDYAKRAGLIVQFEDRILQELVPAAIETFKKAIEDGNVEIAKEVFKGTGFLLRPSEKVPAKGSMDLAENESLEVYIRKIRGGGQNDSADPALPPAGTSIIDVGSVPTDSSERPKALEASVVASGDESRAPDHE